MLVIAAAATVISASGQLTQPEAAQAVAARPFSSTSFWNAPLPASTPTDPKSDIWAANIQSQISRYYGAVGVNTTQYSAPIYTVGPEVAPVQIKVFDCQNKGYTDPNLATQLASVPVPANAVPANGTDAEMVIWQPSSDTVWETWQTQKRVDGWYACWGGRIQNASTSNGVFSNHYGVAATSLSLLGGSMRIDELQAGSINHAIDIGLVETKRNTYSWPAQRTDGWIDDADAISEGQRFRLDPTLNVDSLNISPFAKMVAKAMQKYGMVVRDKAGAVTLYAENPLPMINAGQTNPYNSIFAGRASYQVMDNFPWSRLQALPFDYGKDGSQQSGTPSSGVGAPAITTGSPVAEANNSVSASGYRAATASGVVKSFGQSADKGSANTSNVVGIATTPSRNGYWLAGADGRTYHYGDAVDFGSMAGQKLNAPVVGMAARPTGNGYYLLGRDGGVFSFGDAPFFGSTGSMKLNAPVVGMASTPSGNGYWFVASDGGIFAYGDAAFYGSMGGSPLNKPIVGMASTPSGKGYWLVASDGGIFAYGDAAFYGSTGSIKLNQPIVGMSATATGHGYRFVASDGGIFCFGDATFEGSAAGKVSSGVVGISG